MFAFSKHRWTSRLALGLFVALLAVLTAEYYLRCKGYEPASPKTTVDKSFVLENSTPDRELGWTNTPGMHPPQEDATQPEMVDINGQRRSAPISNSSHKVTKRVAVFGCSYTYGCGVNDADTFVWKLNEQFPTIRFDNYGVPGYGAYQCLAAMKKKLALHPHTYDAIIYAGLIDHANRDFNGAYFEISPFDIACYTSLYKNPQRQRRLELYHWPGDSTFCLINFVKHVCVIHNHNKALSKGLTNTPINTYCDLLCDSIVEMQSLADRHQAKFLYACLDDFPDYSGFNVFYALSLRLYDLNIPFRNCSLPMEWILDQDNPNYQIACQHLYYHNKTYCHHPNARGHAYYARLLGEWVTENLL